MRSRLLGLLGAWLLAAAPVLAQMPPPAPGPAPLIPAATMPPAPPINSEAVTPCEDPPAAAETYHVWARAEYLGWWVKNSPLPVSVVTGNPSNPTQALLNSDTNFGLLSGVRVTLGVWLDPGNNTSMQVSFFGLQRVSKTFSAASDASGNPTLAFPFVNQTPGAVGMFFMPITSPGVFAGNVAVTSTLQLWGAEANGEMLIVSRLWGFELGALAGIRYADLRETLNISTFSSDILTSPTTDLSQSDSFNTRNQFYGGQVGARLNWQADNFGIDLTGKLALGMTHQSVDVQGYSTQTGPGGVNGTFPGGFFTQSSNIGHSALNQFGFIPALELKVYWFITPNVRAFAGYDFLYWSRVVRPGNQVDSNINLSQSTIFGSGSLMGPAFPQPLFNRSDFWAQGINLGLEFRF